MGERPGQSYLDEREEEPHDEVGEPVDSARHDEGCRPLGLLEELAGQDEGDAACSQSQGPGLITPRGGHTAAIHLPVVGAPSLHPPPPPGKEPLCLGERWLPGRGRELQPRLLKV